MEDTHFTRVSTVSARATELIGKVDEKAEQFATSSKIHERDVKSLKTRLSFYWYNECRSQDVSLVTSWRDTTAREAYSQVQDMNDHLLLPFVLAIPPTACSTPAFKKVIKMLQHPRYKTYRLDLSSDSQKILESIAVDCGFDENDSYLQFMQSLFPMKTESMSPEEAPVRQIESVHSLVPLDKLPEFLQALIPGVVSSKTIASELLSGTMVSNCATILIPTQTDDCVCHLILDRTSAVNTIKKFGLTMTSGGNLGHESKDF